METISYTHARGHLAETMDKVCDNNAPVIITRQNARPVVMLSLTDYESIEETVYLLRSPKNAARLAQSIAAVKKGKLRKGELFE